VLKKSIEPAEVLVTLNGITLRDVVVELYIAVDPWVTYEFPDPLQEPNAQPFCVPPESVPDIADAKFPLVVMLVVFSGLALNSLVH